MNLPDMIILAASMGLNVAILPTLFSTRRPPIVTSLGFAVCVSCIGGALLSSQFWFGGGANLLGGLLWLGVALRRVHERA